VVTGDISYLSSIKNHLEVLVTSALLETIQNHLEGHFAPFALYNTDVLTLHTIIGQVIGKQNDTKCPGTVSLVHKQSTCHFDNKNHFAIVTCTNYQHF